MATKSPDEGWDKAKPYRIYSNWVKAGDRSQRAVYTAIQEAYLAGQPGDARLTVLADRERELLEIKGPCSAVRCRLHYAHSGPCDMREGVPRE